MEGTVKWYNKLKGYGFITSVKQDVFVHHSTLPKDMVLKEGDSVSFDTVLSDRGPQAKNVKLL